MTPEATLETRSAKPTAKRFPRICHRCRKKTVCLVTMPYRSQVRHDGTLYSVDLPALAVPRCQECGELYFDNDAEEQVSRAFRQQLHLLMPEQIRANRLTLNLGISELAARLGLNAELLNNWEAGLQFQSRAHDNLLRAFFALPDVRSALRVEGINPSFGSVVVSPS